LAPIGMQTTFVGELVATDKGREQTKATLNEEHTKTWCQTKTSHE